MQCKDKSEDWLENLMIIYNYLNIRNRDLLAYFDKGLFCPSLSPIFSKL